MKRTMAQLFVFTFFIAFSWGVAKAQTTSPHPDAAPANASYVAKDWTKAAELYGHITTAEPKNGRAWYRLGVSLHGKGEHEQAIEALEKAIENGAANFLAEYHLNPRGPGRPAAQWVPRIISSVHSLEPPKQPC